MKPWKLAPAVLFSLAIGAVGGADDQPAENYIKHRHDHSRMQDYLKNKHPSRDIKVRLPTCKKPLANCIGGPTSSVTVVVDAGAREYLSPEYFYFSDKMDAEYE